MTYGRRIMRGMPVPDDPDLVSALDAMSAEDLRAFVRDALERLDDELRAGLQDRLIARAAQGSSGWRPSIPPSGLVEEAKGFAESACRVGHAEPRDVDHYLRCGSKAFLAGDYPAARQVFAAFLPPIADGEIYLGQHEMVDEVLTASEHECAAQYVVNVYITTPLASRAGAVLEAIGAVRGIASFWSPLEQMERVAIGLLPELDAFLPAWVEHLERQPVPESEWVDDRGRWLREAVLRLEGVAGLERVARETERPEAVHAWCEALVERRQWAEALRAYDDAAKMVRTSRWRGGLLDGAALAAEQLGRRDAIKRLQAAWLGAPSLVRLLRWLGAGAPAASTVSKRAKQALERCPTKSGRQLGLLHLLAGNVREAAKLLAKAPGLGWSSDEHPGHILFPAFAGMLGNGTEAGPSATLLAGLREPVRDPLDWDFGDGRRPRLATPAVADLIAVAGPGAKLDSKSRTAMLDAMQSAATKRVEGILGNKRRRHYGHAASLVSCCVELAPAVGKQKPMASWLESLRREHSRFYAFREELQAALASVSSEPEE